MKLIMLLVVVSFTLNLKAQWNEKGVPDNLVDDVEVTSALLRDIDRMLPERGERIPISNPEF